MSSRGVQAGIKPGCLDGGHYGEESGAGVELSQFLRVGTSGQGERQGDCKYEALQEYPPAG
jgi:hypothetical protein